MLLEVNDLKTYFFTADGVIKAVDGVSFTIKEGEILGLVGESGCGKSVTALSIMRLIPQPPGRIVSGSIYFKGRDLLALSEKEMRSIRGNQVTMIFQEPATSLNPVFTIGDQIAEVLIVHKKMTKKEALKEAKRLLELVKIPDADQRLYEYPHQFSGGMKQRVMIAIAIACRPALIIADEPTTALDVTVQAQVLDLLLELKKDVGSSVLIITHDLGIIAGFANRVAVMYAGQIVEYTEMENIFYRPRHPYTKGLLEAVPKISLVDLETQTNQKRRLKTIEGTVPNPLNFPSGCRFHPRCSIAIAKCKEEMPILAQVENNHYVRCFLA